MDIVWLERSEIPAALLTLADRIDRMVFDRDTITVTFPNEPTLTMGVRSRTGHIEPRIAKSKLLFWMERRVPKHLGIHGH